MTVWFVEYVELGASLPDIILVIRLITVSWAGYVARMGGQERCIQDFGVGTKIILKWIFSKWN